MLNKLINKIHHWKIGRAMRQLPQYWLLRQQMINDMETERTMRNVARNLQKFTEAERGS